MNPNDYVKAACCTENKDLVGIALRLRADVLLRVLHGAIGLCTESGELMSWLHEGTRDLVNLEEEAGDLTWYCALICDALNFDMSEILRDADTRLAAMQTAYPEPIFDIVTISGTIMDLLKRAAFYGKPLESEKIKEQLTGLLTQLTCLLRFFDIQRSAAMGKNIAKLRARYPNKFTEIDALTRDLNLEREVLERK